MEGQLRVIDAAQNQTCNPSEKPLNWNQTGPQGPPGPRGPKGDAGPAGANGKDGVSVTSAALAAGDPNCPNGGSSFTASNGTTFACNGAKGDPGPGTSPKITHYVVGSSGAGSADVQCNAGDVATGGGGESIQDNEPLVASVPLLPGSSGPPVGWAATGHDLNDDVQVFAICVHQS